MRWQDRQAIGKMLVAAGWERLPNQKSFRLRNTYRREGLRVCLGNTRIVEVDKKLPTFGSEVVGFASGGAGRGWREALVEQIEKVASSRETS